MDAVQGSEADGRNSRPHLNARQQRFVAEYLLDLNETAAYRRAGYPAKGNAVSVNACRLLGNAKVRAAIATAQKERMERLQVEADDVIRELKRVAFSDIGVLARWGTEGEDAWDVSRARQFLRVCPTNALFPNERAAIKKIQEGKYGLSIEMHDKVAALTALAKHFGLLNGEGRESEKDEIGVPKIPLETLRELQRRDQELQEKLRKMGLSDRGNAWSPSK